MSAQPKSTFSESWHRVANLRVHLQPTIDVQRQFYRGERWYVVHNRFNNEFFRLRPPAYEFLVRLEGRTVEEVWQQSLQHAPEEAPTQGEVIELLGRLYQANLLRSTLPANTTQLFARQQRQRQREWRARWLNLFSIQLSLWDPDEFLVRVLPLVRPFLSRTGMVVWLLVVGAAIKVALDHAPELGAAGENVLAPANLPLLYLALFGIKAIHEMGHALACRRFGGEVHRMGVALFFFSPVPFVDATSSWAFRSKWKRIFVASGGMIAELFVASLATFVWAQTVPGVLHSVAYNVIFIASVTTVLFNANPLLRYDGYYILSDLLELPNFAARSMAYLQYLAEHYLFGVPQPTPARDRREGLTLALYGLASWAYRFLLFSSISLFLATRYLLLGLIMAVVCLFGWTVQPLWRLGQYLLGSPRLIRHRQRAWTVMAGGGAAIALFLGLVPMPNHFRAPGVLETERWSDVFAGTSGYLEETLARSGSEVEQGAPLLRLRNRELELENEAAEAAELACRTALDRATTGRAEQIRALQDREAALQQRLDFLVGQRKLLVIRAPQAGIWSAPEARNLVGSWLPRGTPVGKVLDPRSGFAFTAVVAQTDAASLFAKQSPQAEVRLYGQEERTFPVLESRISPGHQETLRSAALGWRGGGEVAVAANDPHGIHSQEPFFEVRSDLAPSPHLRFGCSGKIRFTLPPEPLLRQWERRIRQLLQRQLEV